MDTPLGVAWVRTFAGAGTQGGAAPFADQEDVWLQTEVSSPTVFGAGEAKEVTLDADTQSVVHVWMKASGDLDRAERSSSRPGGVINGATMSGPVAVLSNGDRLIGASVSGQRVFAPGQAHATTIDAPAATAGSGQTSARWGAIGRYDAQGTLAWMRAVGGKTVMPSALEAFEDGTFMLAGQFAEALSLGGNAFAAPPGQIPSFVAQHAADGAVAWARVTKGTATIYAMATRARDHATFVTGTFRDAITFGAGEAHETTLTSHATSALKVSAYVARYDANGDLAWAKTVGDDVVTHSIVRTRDALVVAGNFVGTTKIGGATYTSAGERDAFLMKMDDGGQEIWVRQIRGVGDDVVDTLRVAPDGKTWALGATTSPSLDIDAHVLSSQSANDAYALVLDDAGNVRRRETLANDVIGIGGLAFHPSGALTITGQAGPGTRIGGKSLVVQGAADTFIARFVP